MYKNLISAQKVIDIAFTNTSTDPALIKDEFINIAQEEHIRPALGYTGKIADSLYEQIVTQNATGTLTSYNQTLLDDFIRPALAFYVKLEALQDMNVNTTSKGLMVAMSDTSRAANTNELAALANKVKSHADTLRDKMVRYLNDEDNIDNYPLYRDAVKRTVSQTGGLILDGSDAPMYDDYPGRVIL
jgi:hypothetical protein